MSDDDTLYLCRRGNEDDVENWKLRTERKAALIFHARREVYGQERLIR